MIHQTEAESVNDAMNARVHITLEPSVSTQDEKSETVEAPKKVRNLGAPPEGSGISIVTAIRKFSDTEPECAESTEDPGVWFYNFPAFDRLVKM